MKKLLFILMLPALVSAQIPMHIFDSQKSDTSASGIIKPSQWDDYHKARPDTCLSIYDEFTGGTTTTGFIGMLGFSFIAVQGGSLAIIPGIANRTGIDSIFSGVSTTAAGGSVAVYLSPVGTIGLYDTSGFIDMIFKIKQNFVGDTDICRIGLANDASVSGTTAPNDGLYFETLTSETQWFAVIRNSTVGETRTAVANTDTNWHTFRIRRLDFSPDSIGFSIDGGTEIRYAVNHANYPNIALSPSMMVRNGDRARNQTFSIDYFQLLITELSR